MSFPPRRSEQGFTLVEVLLAVSLVAVIAAMVFSGLYLSATAIEQARAAAADERFLRSTLQVMAEELGTSINLSSGPWLGINAQQDGQPADTVAFLSIGQFRSTDLASETETVRIVYTKDEDRLLRVVRRNLYGLTDESIDHMNLAVKVKGFNVRYYDRTTNVWSDEWDGRARNGVPSAVLIELTLMQESAQPWTIRQWVSLGMRS
ncbi:MAG TPA: type II secretion system protein GspJ [Nitrospira sp.]|nr:type II secretion system protein GspJ [Nitrospira sp.]